MANISIDTIPNIIDNITLQRVHSRTASVVDIIPTMVDTIGSSGVIDLTSSGSKWLSLVNITPKTSIINPLYFSGFPIRHPSRYYEPRLMSHGQFTRAISAPIGFIKTGDCTLTIADSNNDIRQQIGTKAIKQAQVDVFLGQEGQPTSSFIKLIGRKLIGVNQNQEGALDFVLRDYIWAKLEQQIPSLMTKANFPNLPEEFLSSFAPIIFGHVSARSVMNANKEIVEDTTVLDGAISPICIDPVERIYLAARHPCRSIEVWGRSSSNDPFEYVYSSLYDYYTYVIPSGHTVQLFKMDNDDFNELRINVEGAYISTPRNSFVGFYGLYDDYIEAIGMLYTDNITGETLKTAQRGWPGGSVFSDLEAIPDGYRISAINVWSGTYLDAIQLVYSKTGEADILGTKHGGPGGTKHVFTITEAEYVFKINCRYGQYIDHIIISTTLKSSPWYGGTGGSVPFETSIDDLEGVNFADAIYNLLISNLGIEETADKINTSSFDAVRNQVAALICAGAFTKQMSWGEGLTQLQLSSNIDIFCDKYDRLTAKYTDETATSVITLNDNQHLVKGSIKQTGLENSYNQLPYNYMEHYINNTWIEGSYDNVEDQASVDGEIIADEPLLMHFVRDATTALAVITKRAEYLSFDSYEIEGEIPLAVGLSLELGDLIDISHFGKFD
jgi:hypothetical protein